MDFLRTIGAAGLVAATVMLIGCGGETGRLPAGQLAPQSPLLLRQAKKKNCTTPCIYVANETSASVTIYPENAKGNVAPAGFLSGSNTELNDVWGVAFDAANNVYVANYHGALGFGSVTVYSAGSRGNVAPIAQITGPPSGDTMVNPSDVALDAAGDIYVSAYFSNSVSVYAPGANGSSMPIRYISGSNTNLDGPSYLYVTPKGKLYVANFLGASLNVYAPNATGNVAPIQTISGSATGMYRASGVAVDGKGDIYVSSAEVGTPSGCCVTVYDKKANGDVEPIRSISGGKTRLTGPDGIALDSQGNIYVTQYGPGATPAVTVYANKANGDVAPIRTIEGSKTGIDGPAGIIVH